jgi:hypothetical protein
MSEKKPPDGFDPLKPPEDDEQDPHLQKTSPYDVATLAQALGSVDDEHSDDHRFIDFGPTERSVPVAPALDSGAPAASPAPDPDMFPDDTEVMPPGSLPAGLAQKRPAELDLPPPPVKSESGEAAPAPTALEHARSDLITPDPITSSVERPVVTGAATPVASASPAPVDSTPGIPRTRDYVVDNAIPAEVSFSMAGQPVRVDTLQLPVPLTAGDDGPEAEASAAPPSLADDASEATTHIHPNLTDELTQGDESSAIADLPTAEAMSAPQGGPAPVEEAFEELEPLPASRDRPAHANFDETTAAVPPATELLEPPNTVAQAPPPRPGASVMAALFFVGLLLTSVATLLLLGGSDENEPATRSSSAAQPGAPAAAPPVDKPAEDEPAAALEEPEEPASDEPAAEEPALALEEPAGSDEPELSQTPATKPVVKPRARKAKTARRAKRPRRSRTVYVVGVRDGSGARVKGSHVALRSGFVTQLRKGRRWKIGRGAPGDNDRSVRLRLDGLKQKSAGGTKRVVAQCTARLFEPGGDEKRRVRAVGGAHGEKVTRKLQLQAISACGEQVGDELRSSMRRLR